MKNFLMMAAAVLSAGAQAQTPTIADAQLGIGPAKTVTLRRDTPVELMATREVSTADASPGQIFKLRINRAIAVEGEVVIPAGATAFGQVVAASDAGGLGKSGRMTAKLLHIQLGDVQIPLEGEMSAKGTGAGSAGLAILFTGWAGFFHRGNNAKIKAGEILAGYVGSDTVFDLSNGVAKPLSSTQVANQSPAPQ